MEKLLVVTYDQDLPQFEMMCHCLNKNWQGTKRLTVVYGKSVDPLIDMDQQINEIIQQNFNDQWSIDIHDGRISIIDGYHEQQINKIRFSLDSDDTIVFDSKDFLLKKSNLDDFKQDHRYVISYHKSNKNYNDLYPRAKEVVPEIHDHTPTTLYLTPWIWPRSQLEKFWNHLIAKFGPFEQWQEFPGHSEWATFFAYTYHDTSRTIEITNDEYEHIKFGGAWSFQDFSGGLEQMQEFDRWPERKVWKHTRRTRDPALVVISAMVLEKYQIDRKLIARWAKSNLDRFFG